MISQDQSLIPKESYSPSASSSYKQHKRSWSETRQMTSTRANKQGLQPPQLSGAPREEATQLRPVPTTRFGAFENRQPFSSHQRSKRRLVSICPRGCANQSVARA